MDSHWDLFGFVWLLLKWGFWLLACGLLPGIRMSALHRSTATASPAPPSVPPPAAAPTPGLSASVLPSTILPAAGAPQSLPQSSAQPWQHNTPTLRASLASSPQVQPLASAVTRNRTFRIIGESAAPEPPIPAAPAPPVPPDPPILVVPAPTLPQPVRIRRPPKPNRFQPKGSVSPPTLCPVCRTVGGRIEPAGDCEWKCFNCDHAWPR
jgi:hypothetical protein